MASRQDLRQSEAKTQSFKQLGTTSGTSLGTIVDKINTEFNSPLKISASFPTANALLNFEASKIAAGDGANEALSPLKSQVHTLVASTINFQTQTTSGATFIISWPTSTVGFFRRAGFSLLGNGSVQVLFSEEASTLAALSNPGALFIKTGVALGYIELQATSTSAFKTAGSASNIVENSGIFRFSTGGSGGSGTGDANAFTENLKHRLTNSYFQFVTPCVFETDELTLINSTTATFDLVDGVLKFTAAGQTFTSKQLFCQEFLDSGDNSVNVEVHVEWFDTTSIDTAALYEVSTDGTTWYTVPMTRQGQSTKYTGSVKTGTVSNTQLLLRVTGSASNKKLKAFGVFYDEQVGSVITGIQALQKFIFSGDANTFSFTLTNFLPDANRLKVYDLKTGQVYRYGAFTLSGKTVSFPAFTFLVPGDTIELLFDQSEGSGFDNSDQNGNLLASNSLGSMDNTVDKSIAGQGPIIRNKAGKRRMIYLDENDNIIIKALE
jgi:hypothetical protein